MELSLLLGYAGAVLTGFVLGLMGGGGALFSIPVLVYLFHIEPSVATGYSLFLVGIAASFGAVQNLRKKMVDYRVAIYYGIPSMISIYLVRRFLIPNLPQTICSIGSFTLTKDRLILLLLTSVMFGVGINLVKNKGEGPSGNKMHVHHYLMLMFYAALIGGFLGLVGAGGGFLIIPALVLLADLPIKRAIGTSLLLVAVNSFIGFAGDLHSGEDMDWKFLAVFSVLAVSGVFAGNYAGRHIDNHKLRTAFGWLMLLSAIYILAKETVL